MLFMAYLMQQRANDAAIDSLQDSLTSFESIDELLNENQELRRENESLEDQAAELEEQLHQAQDSADSWRQKYDDQTQQQKESQADARTWQGSLADRIQLPGGRSEGMRRAIRRAKRFQGLRSAERGRHFLPVP